MRSYMSELPTVRKLMAIPFLLAFSLGLIGQATPQGPHALVAELDGAINPVSQRFISRAIDKAANDGADIMILTLDTPGGLLSSTREIVQDLLNASVATAVYVSPAGAQAASAGTFVTTAANFAVMAPGTNIGAASPVASGGNDVPETIKSKVIEDTTALMRSIAQQRDRNAEAMEDTVKKATAYNSDEAVELNVVDFVAKDVNDLLTQVDGLTVDTATGSKKLETEGLKQRSFRMNFFEKFLFFLADPNVSFLLLSLGGLGLVVELFNPGLIVPGVAGAIFLILAFLSLGNLPVNWAAVGFIVLALILVVAELLISGFGVLGIGAIVSFIFGGLLLFDSFGTPSPTNSPTSVNLWLLGSLSTTLTLLGTWFLRTMVRSRKAQRHDVIPESPLVGATGVVVADLAPRGTIHVADEVWTAVSGDGTVIRIGQQVKIHTMEGPVLTVFRTKLDTDVVPFSEDA